MKKGRPRTRFGIITPLETRAEIHTIFKRRMESKTMRESFFKGKSKKDLKKAGAHTKQGKELIFFYAMLMHTAYEAGHSAGLSDLNAMIDSTIIAIGKK